MAIEEKPIIQDNEDFAPLTPITPDNYQGKQVIINADRLIFNARRQLTQEAKGAANTYEGGDIHLFSNNLCSSFNNNSFSFNNFFFSLSFFLNRCF